MTTQSDASVLLDSTGGVGWITLNRPEVYNALNTDMAERLLDAVIRCDEDDTIRAVVITGIGASFCAGGDIRQMIDSGASEGNAARFLKTLTVSLHAAIATIAYISKPVVMAVNGAAAGAGFSLALAGDLVLAADNARFTVAYTAIGLARTAARPSPCRAWSDRSGPSSSCAQTDPCQPTRPRRSAWSTRCFRRRSSASGRGNSQPTSPAGRPPRSAMPSGS
jgi:Enoyl-CoA hydratase/isomerase